MNVVWSAVAAVLVGLASVGLAVAEFNTEIVVSTALLGVTLAVLSVGERFNG